MEIIIKKLEEIMKLARRGKRPSGVTKMIGKPAQEKGSGGVLKSRKGRGAVQKTRGSGGNPKNGGKGPTLLFVCNLDYGVEDADIMELFNEDGLILNGTVHYDRNGKSLGTAELALRNHFDAMKVIKKFHAVRLDGRRLKIHLVQASPNINGRAFKTRNKKRPIKSSEELDSTPGESFASDSANLQEPKEGVMMP